MYHCNIFIAPHFPLAAFFIPGLIPLVFLSLSGKVAVCHDTNMLGRGTILGTLDSFESQPLPGRLFIRGSLLPPASTWLVYGVSGPTKPWSGHGHLRPPGHWLRIATQSQHCVFLRSLSKPIGNHRERFATKLVVFGPSKSTRLNDLDLIYTWVSTEQCGFQAFYKFHTTFCLVCQ